MKKIGKTKLACMFSFAFALASCNIDMPKETPSSFETLTVKKQNITVPIKFSAKMRGQADVTITPQVNGQLTQIRVSEGQQVVRGQVLFVIDSRTAQHDVESAQANLQAAQANLTAAQAQANSARLEYESNKNLFEKKIVSRYMLDNSLNNYKQAQAAITQAKAAISQAQAAVNQARVNLGFCTITSPVSGVIGEIPVRAGDQVSPATQLTIVSGNTFMEAEFSLPESVLESAVAAGYSVKSADALRGLPEVTFVMKNGHVYEHKGRVSSTTGIVNATTGSISCKATFPNPDGQLYSGVQGSVVLPDEMKGVIVVPQIAVVRLQDRSLVYKVKADSTVTAVVVTTEDAGNGKDFIIRKGLNVGDKIVTDGANNVQEGQKVLFSKQEEKK